MDTRTRILEASWQLLEAHRGRGVSMADIARSAGISRQALYLHFASRSELMIATMNYVDEVKGLNARLDQLAAAASGVELLDGLVEVWGNYIPQIHGLAKAMLLTRDTDEAMAAAWNNSMGCLRELCQSAVQRLAGEGRLAGGWSVQQATDLFWTMISISSWEQLTVECGWSNAQYVEGIKTLLRRSFVE